MTAPSHGMPKKSSRLSAPLVLKCSEEQEHRSPCTPRARLTAAPWHAVRPPAGRASDGGVPPGPAAGQDGRRITGVQVCLWCAGVRARAARAAGRGRSVHAHEHLRTLTRRGLRGEEPRGRRTGAARTRISEWQTQPVAHGVHTQVMIVGLTCVCRRPHWDRLRRDQAPLSKGRFKLDAI